MNKRKRKLNSIIKLSGIFILFIQTKKVKINKKKKKLRNEMSSYFNIAGKITIRIQ